MSCAFQCASRLESRKENGVQSPTHNGAVSIEILTASAEAGHWGNLRRQRQQSFEVQVRRTAGDYIARRSCTCACICRVKTFAAAFSFFGIEAAAFFVERGET